MLPVQITTATATSEALQILETDSNHTIVVVENESINNKETLIFNGRIYIKLNSNPDLIRNIKVNGKLYENPVITINGREITIQPDEFVPLVSFYNSQVMLTINTPEKFKEFIPRQSMVKKHQLLTDLDITVDCGYMNQHQKEIYRQIYMWEGYRIIDGYIK